MQRLPGLEEHVPREFRLVSLLHFTSHSLHHTTLLETPVPRFLALYPYRSFALSPSWRWRFRYPQEDSRSLAPPFRITKARARFLYRASRTAIRLHRPTARRAAFASNARREVFSVFLHLFVFFLFFFFVPRSNPPLKPSSHPLRSSSTWCSAMSSSSPLAGPLSSSRLSTHSIRTMEFLPFPSLTILTGQPHPPPPVIKSIGILLREDSLHCLN